MSVDCSNPFRKGSRPVSQSLILADDVSWSHVRCLLADRQVEVPRPNHGPNNPESADSKSFQISPEPASFIDELEYAPKFISKVDPSPSLNKETSPKESKVKEFDELSEARMDPFDSTSNTTTKYSKEEETTYFMQNRISPGKQTLDINAFKQLLMAGNSNSGTIITEHRNQNLSSRSVNGVSYNTKRISVSEKSVNGWMLEPYCKSSQTSDDESEADKYPNDPNMTVSPQRQKPPPPSSRHGRQIWVQLKDDLPSGFTQHQCAIDIDDIVHSPNPYRKSTYSQLKYTQNILNKPLPPAPSEDSKNLEHHPPVFLEAPRKMLPKSDSGHRKRPPTPPLTGQYSQSMNNFDIAVDKFAVNSGYHAVCNSSSSIGQISTLSRSNSGKAPQPPPRRRPGTSQSLAENKPFPTSTLQNTRSRGRNNTSNASLSTISGVNMCTNKRPPPPPPQRAAALNSVLHRESVENAPNRASVHPHALISKDAGEKRDLYQRKPNILADLNQLQKEIDELRVKWEDSATI